MDREGSVKIRNWWSVKLATSQSAFLVHSRGKRRRERLEISDIEIEKNLHCLRASTYLSRSSWVVHNLMAHLTIWCETMIATRDGGYSLRRGITEALEEGVGIAWR